MRSPTMTTPEYAGPAGIHVRGESSAGFDQHSYSLELWDDAAKDFDASLLGMPADSDWVLIGPWSEKTLMRNKLVFDWMLALRGEDGHSAVVQRDDLKAAPRRAVEPAELESLKHQALVASRLTHRRLLSAFQGAGPGSQRCSR